jgi:3-oxoacyl-[acyl-carrier protein] reductase
MSDISPVEPVPSRRLSGKTAVVTGAARGIGRAVAIRLAQEGADVVIADVNLGGSEETAELVVREGAKATTVTLDVGDIRAVEATLQEVSRRHGLDILVNNAGITGTGELMTVEPEEWDRIVAVNLRGAFFCLQSAAREMIPRRSGRIVNMSSIAAKGYRNTGSMPYAAAKAGLIAITRLAAVRLAEHSITVNAICPGPTRSPMNMVAAEKIAAEKNISLDEAYAVYDEHIPIRRSNDPADVAAAVAFLASDDARHITGQSLNVDGGLTFD